MTRNVYYEPESFGLTVFGDADRDDLAYEYDMFVVWRNAAGDFLWADDSGCSCPIPFESYTLENLPIGSARDALTDLRAWVLEDERRRRAAASLVVKLEAVAA